MLKRRRAWTSAALVAACLLGTACGAREGAGSVSGGVSGGGQAGAGGAGAVRTGVQATDLGDGRWSLEVNEQAVSLLVTVHGSGVDDTVTIDRLVAPDGTDLTDTLAFRDSGGELSILLPRHADDPSVGGTWVVEASAHVAVADVTGVAKHGDPDRPQHVDLAVVVFSDHPDVTEDSWPELLELWTSTGDEALGPHDLSVGRIEFAPATPQAIDVFNDLPLPTSGDDAAQRELCQVLPDAHDRSLWAAEWQVHVAIVDRILDPDDDKGETEGNASGIPGSLGFAGSSTSCVVVVADGSRSLFDMPEVLWHEVGHQLGLPHTTESTGDAFDFFVDTAECDVDLFDRDGDEYLDADECADADADNLMFHDGEGRGLSDEQAWLLRRHPLFLAD